MSAWWAEGVSDVCWLTLTEVVAHARRIARGVDIPVFCDADTGYGAPINVQRTVEEFMNAGIAGTHIEDQRNPKTSGGPKPTAHSFDLGKSRQSHPNPGTRSPTANAKAPAAASRWTSIARPTKAGPWSSSPSTSFQAMAQHRRPIRQTSHHLPLRGRPLFRSHLAIPIRRHAMGLMVNSLSQVPGKRTLT
jgi:hypothetical protein